MYNLFYCFIFKLIEKRNPDPQFGAASFVWIMQFIHIAFLLAIVKKVFNLSYPVLSDTYFWNKLLFAPIAIIWLWLTFRYFRKRSDLIIKRFEVKRVVTLKNALITTLFLMVPLILMIQLLKK